MKAKNKKEVKSISIFFLSRFFQAAKVKANRRGLQYGQNRGQSLLFRCSRENLQRAYQRHLQGYS